MVTIVWDEPKRQSNLARHGLDLADPDEWFFLDAVTAPALTGRHMAIGRLNDEILAVVFAALGTGAFGDLHASRKPQGKEPVMTNTPPKPVSDAQMAEAKPFPDAFPALAEQMRRHAGGRPRSASPKVPVSLRLDRDVVARFKAGGTRLAKPDECRPAGRNPLGQAVGEGPVD